MDEEENALFNAPAKILMLERVPKATTQDCLRPTAMARPVLW